MNKALISAAIATLALAGEVHPGKCPEKLDHKNCSLTFSKKDIAGLWFDYVWDTSFQDGYSYQCSMWTVLQDLEKDTMMAYNHVADALPEEDRTKEKTTTNKLFGSVDFNWYEPCEGENC